MSFLSRVFGGRAAVGVSSASVSEPPLTRSTVNTAHPRDPVLADWFGGGGAGTPAVTPRSALGIPAVYACVNLLAESLGALPLTVRRRSTGPDEAWTEATDHPVHVLLTGRPCPHMTGVEFIEWVVSNTALRGDAFSRIVSNRAGEITALVPIEFTGVRPEQRDDGGMRYVIHGPRRAGTRAVLQDDEMFRMPWKVQADGLSLSPIGMQRESFAMALAARRYQLSLMTNAATPKGAVKAPTELSPEAQEKLIASWERRHAGPDNAGRLAVFDGGLEWVNIGMSNEDAQFAEIMQMSIRDVARAFRIQPHKIGDMEKATFSNIEHQSIEFVTDTLLPWVRRFEARADNWLLSPAERKSLAVEFNLRGLLRGDAKARSEMYRALFYAGAINANEIRRMEGMNPIDGGERFFVQTGSSPTDIIDQVLLKSTPASDGNTPPPPPPPGDDETGDLPGDTEQ